MTDKQLAILLRQLSQRLKVLANDARSNITDGKREAIRVWIGEGPEPIFTLNFSRENWSMQNIGEFVAVQMVLDFANELEAEAEELSKIE